MADLTPAQRFGKRVCAKRMQHGWSMRQVAARAGIASANTVMRAERGDEIGLSIAVRIAGELGISLDALAKLPRCGQCDDRPPRGFTCNTCAAGRP